MTYGWPYVATPEFSVIQPLSRQLLAVEQDGQRYDDRCRPNETNEQGRTPLGNTGLHGEHDPEETIAADERQSQDARH